MSNSGYVAVDSLTKCETSALGKCWIGGMNQPAFPLQAAPVSRIVLSQQTIHLAGGF